MDPLIKRFDCSIERYLKYCRHRGVAYQADMRKGRVSYGSDYTVKVEGYAGTDIAKRVNAGRLALIERWVSKGTRFIDYGSGSGDFIRYALDAGWDAHGYEVMPKPRASLIAQGRYSATVEGFKAVCLWDVLEHLEDPNIVLQTVDRNSYLFVSLPIFDSLDSVVDSKHYRPGEHLYYWTRDGFVSWMQEYGFRLVEESNHETDAGRENIGAFAFVKDFPSYHEHVAAYSEIHASRHYGASSTELYLDLATAVVQQLKPKSILDFGCGRSDLVAHFYRDGERRIARYDPAIPLYKVLPDGEFDLAFCCDVMEHIPLIGVDRVLSDLRGKSSTVLFTISTKLARAKLPDGRNSHVTLLTKSEWSRWIFDYWSGGIKRLPSKWDHELVIVAGDSAGITGEWVEKP